MTIKEMNTILLDKKKRVEIYKKAYEIHLKILEYHTTYGICIDIKMAIDDIYGYKFTGRDLYLPEFYSLKPKDLLDEYAYWWPDNDLKVRKRIYENYLINIE